MTAFSGHKTCWQEAGGINKVRMRVEEFTHEGDNC